MGTDLAYTYKKSNNSRPNLLILSFVVLLSILFCASTAYAVDITLEWIGSAGADGYRLFYREEGQSYTYNLPDWEGATTTATIYGLDDNSTYHFVARAFNQYGESGDSNEETYNGLNQPPTASFTASPTTGDAPLSVSFNASGSTDPDGTIVSYSWVFGDGGSATGVSPSHTYNSAGSYTVTLTVTDDEGATDNVSTQIQVTTPANQPPTASFTASPTTGDAPLSVSFNASGSTDPDGTIVSYSWVFGDGGSATGVSPSHTYNSAGSYTVTLTVTDDGGATDNVSTQIQVTTPANQPPTASFTASPTTGDAPLSVSFNASGSTDPDGTIVSYSWVFGDGGSATGVSPSHTYNSAGSYTVTLTVTDDGGATDNVSTQIQVTTPANQPPTASFTANPTSGEAPLTVSFNASGSGDPDGVIESYSWDFGDGVSGSGLSGSHTYTSAGNYTVTLTVTDDDAATDVATAQIQVSGVPNQNPTASFTANPTSGDAPLTVNFNASGSSDADGAIVSYSWDFEDGTGSGVLLSGTFTSQGESIEFLSPETETFSISYDIVLTGPTDMGVCLQSQERSPSGWDEFSYILNTNGGVFEVRDGDTYRADVVMSYEVGRTYRVKMEVDVPAKIYDVYVTEDGTTTQIADDYNIRNTASDATNIARVVYFGNNGATVTNVILNEGTIVGSDPQITHTYTSGGTYTARLMVTDDEGATDNVSTQIQVTTPANQPPTASFTASPTTGDAPLSVSFNASGSTDPDGTIVSYSWVFGDGGSATGVSASHTYNSAGSYPVTLTVTDDGGATDNVSTQIQVTTPANQPPTASFTASPTTGDAPLSVSFNASGSTDPDGTIVSYSWVFGDGGSATGVSPSHTYNSAGSYTVTFTVTDDGGATDNVSTQIQVTTPANQPPTASFTASPTTGDAPLDVSFNASSSSDPDGTIVSYSWAFGDGATGTGVSPSHTYTSAGTYTVRLTVTDDGITAESDSTSMTIMVVDPSVGNLAPDQAVITSPYYSEMECDLLESIKTEPFSDPDGDTHKESRWQIVKKQDSTVVLDITSSKNLTELPVPHTVLDRDTTYNVSVQFYDASSEPSEWSDPVEFTTTSDIVDFDDDGIPDDREVDDTIDLNDDGIPDNNQPDEIKCVESAVAGHVAICVSKISVSIDAIEALETISPSEILDKKNKPNTFVFGLASYRLRVKQLGDIAIVRIYYSEDIAGAKIFYMYNSINGWQDYTEHVIFNEDGRSVTVELKDGGHGDSDGVANGIIVDPGGVTTSVSGGLLDSGALKSGCFIATAAFGSYVEPNVKLLREFRDQYLLTNSPGRGFVKVYYKYGPFAAEYIREHDWLKPIVRVLLMPLVGVSYVLVRTSLATMILVGLLLIISMLVCWKAMHRSGRHEV